MVRCCGAVYPAQLARQQHPHRLAGRHNQSQMGTTRPGFERNPRRSGTPRHSAAHVVAPYQFSTRVDTQLYRRMAVHGQLTQHFYHAVQAAGPTSRPCPGGGLSGVCRQAQPNAVHGTRREGDGVFNRRKRRLPAA